MTVLNDNEFVTPAGRLVLGSLYDPQTTDINGVQKTYKTGAKNGQPREDYFFALAVPKGAEQSWKQTEWGARIVNVGNAAFPKGQARAPAFAWKILDGNDNSEYNAKGTIRNIKPCEREGYPGNWIVNFSSTFAPRIVDARTPGKPEFLLEKDFINLGDWVQIAGSIVGNNREDSPGVHLNHNCVALIAFGTRIARIVNKDPAEYGFGVAQLPPGASLHPVAAMPSMTQAASQTYAPPAQAASQTYAPPAQVAAQYVPPTQQQWQNYPNAASPAAVAQGMPFTAPPAAVTPAQYVPPVQATPEPYPAILDPATAAASVAPPPTTRRVLPHAQYNPGGIHSYEQLIAGGWNDTTLAQYGMLG